MFLVLNNFMETVVDGINRGLTVTDNMVGSILTQSFTSLPSLSIPISIGWSQSLIPTVVLVGKVSGGSVSASPGVSWQMNSANTAILITGLFGVSTPTTSAPITLTFVILTR
jgi:hypothetical protein